MVVVAAICTTDPPLFRWRWGIVPGFGFIWIDFKFGGSCSLSGLLLVLLRFCQIGWPWLGLSRFEFFYLFFYFIEAFGVG